MNPPLSSIDQEKFALGEKAVNRILERLKNPELPPAHVITKPSFIKRDSA
jgi:DNA-binding LacI/PurR family transcriptional regulator